MSKACECWYSTGELESADDSRVKYHPARSERPWTCFGRLFCGASTCPNPCVAHGARRRHLGRGMRGCTPDIHFVVEFAFRYAAAKRPRMPSSVWKKRMLHRRLLVHSKRVKPCSENGLGAPASPLLTID